MHLKHVIFGALFGFVLSRAGATDYDAIAGMFRLTDLHLFGVIGTAVAVSAIGFFLARKRGWKTRSGETPVLAKKPMTPGLVVGALAFGVGWAISGTCPGTALAQIGEGRLAGIVTFAGILLGAWLERRSELRRRRALADEAKSGEADAGRASAVPGTDMAALGHGR